MTQEFSKHINAHFAKLKTSRAILAISGGVDSVVLAHLLHEIKIPFAMAHCNFNLRGEASDGDEQFVEKLAEKLDVEVFTQGFDTLAFAKENKLSTQMAARELRYQWFEELRSSLNFDFILTAHHANDDFETFLINLSRGTGLDGLLAIPENNGHIVRPLIPFSRDVILAYAKKHSIEWREDSSNDSDHYLRNHLRHHAVPPIVEKVPHFLSNFGESQKHLADAKDLLDDYIALLYDQIVIEAFNGYQFNIAALKTIPHRNAVIYQLLKHFNFTAWDDIYALIDAQTGKYVSSGTHRIIKNRDHLLLTVAREPDAREILIAENECKMAHENLQLCVSEVDTFDEVNTQIAYFEKAALKFPLKLRKWQEGDYFYPFGMRGKKKVSKYFKDKKFSAIDKEKTWILCSGEDIIWIVGHRTDDRYKVDRSKNDTILKIEAKYIN